jgi:cysteine desulfurase
LTEKHGFNVTYVKPEKNGLISIESIENALQHDTALVSIMHVNNELGTINPIGAIGKLCFERGILFHSDAAQSLGKIPIDVDDLNIDLLSLSAHKIGGPKGIGAIYIRELRKRQLSPVIHGAGQEEGLRGGTVAAPLITAFAVAVQTFPEYYSKLIELNLKERLIKLLREHQIEFQINGRLRNSLEHIVSISFKNIDVSGLQRKVQTQIALAQGSACSSKEIEPSHVLASLNMTSELAANTLRVSFSHMNKLSDLDQLVVALGASSYINH